MFTRFLEVITRFFACLQKRKRGERRDDVCVCFRLAREKRPTSMTWWLRFTLAWFDDACPEFQRLGTSLFLAGCEVIQCLTYLTGDVLEYPVGSGKCWYLLHVFVQEVILVCFGSKVYM